MHSPSTSTTRRAREEQTLAVAVILWVMLAGACVVVANAWASGA